MSEVRIQETFESIQGESTYAGLPCFFIRLAGCNLRCVYCDTSQAWEEDSGEARAIGDLVNAATRSACPIVEITGGEPLLQPGFRELAQRLVDESGKTLLVETNGTRDISIVPERAVTVMDIKCPGSGEGNHMDWNNSARLRAHDEVKFVVGDRRDYEWARDVTRQHEFPERCRAVLMSPVHGRLPAKQLGQWILADGLCARLQIQLHKVAGLV